MTARRVRRRALGMASWLALGVLAWLLWPVNLGGCTSLIIVNGESMLPTLQPGDLAVARCGPAQVGDVVIYRPFEGNPVAVIHRLAAGNGITGWTARGDNNTFDDPFTFTDHSIVGVMVASIPKAGFALSFLTAPLLWLTLALGATAAYLWPSDDEDDEPGDDHDDRPDGGKEEAHDPAESLVATAP